MPGANLKSYGAVRDIEKWPARDRRRLRRDVINFEEYNPYVAQAMIRAVDTLHTLADSDPDAATYNYRKVIVRAPMLQRGIALYNKAIVASLGAMLGKGAPAEACDGSGRWLDLAGQYVTKRETEAILAAVDRGELATTEAVDARFRRFAARYDDYARDWAERTLGALLGHAPSAEEIADAVRAGANAHAALRRMTDNDRDRDRSWEMAVSYGLDCDSDDERRCDYKAVRGLE